MALVSMRMTPNNAIYKLESAPKGYGVRLPVAAGTAVDVSVWYRKSDTSDGVFSLYGGSQPRLIQRANAALGQPNDVVIATASDTPLVTPNAIGWSQPDSPKVTISGSNLVATNTDTTGEMGARLAAANAQLTGKYYLETTITSNTVNGTLDGIGVATTATTFVGFATQGIGGCVLWFNNGAAYAAGSFTSITFGPGVLIAGVTIGMAVDLDLRRVWYRLPPSGNWNNNAANNPVTNVGGIAIIAGAMTPVMPFGGGGNTGCVRTTNFGGSAFMGTPPAGFAPGWQASTTTSDWVQLSGTSSIATDDGVWEFVVDCDGIVGWINIDDWNFTGMATTANGMKNWYQGMPLVGGGGGGGGAYFQGGFV